MKNAIIIIGEGRRKRYTVSRVGWCSSSPLIPGSFSTLEAAQAAAADAGIHIDVVGGIYAVI